MLATEVERKLSFLLSERGYRVVSDQASADYALLAVFGIGEPTTEYLGTVMMPVGGMLMSVPRSRTTHLRWMVIGAVDAETAAAYQAGDQIDWSWFAEVYSAGSSNDLRSVVDFVLVEAIELFPRCTGRAVAATVNESDRRVRELREWMNGSD